MESLLPEKISRFQRILTRLHSWDKTVCIKISSVQGRRIMDRFMFAVSHFGYGYVYPVIFLFVFIVDYSNTRLILHIGFVSFLIEHTTHKWIKNRIRRHRPFHALPQIINKMSIPDPFSFPSGHAAGAFVMASLMQYFYPHLSIPLYLGAGLIGVSRVYNGVHYPSDVIAGSALGILSARVSILIFA